ncbi:MAG: family 10 glycosylhydrolase, partial [Bacillota bacterium]
MTRMMTKAMRVRPGAVLLFVSALLVGLCSWVSGASEAEAPVAIVVSEASRAYYDGQGWVGAYDRIVNSMKLSLEEAGIRYNLLSTDDVVSGKLQGYRVASLMTNASMSRPEVVAIRRFVQAGGKILGAYEVSQLDERQQPAGDAQLGEIFGIKVIGWDRGKYDYIRALDRSHPIFAGLPEFIATARSMTFVVEPIRGGKAIGAWYRADRQTPSRPHPQDAAVVITESSVYVGENIFDRANDDPMLRFLIANMIRYLLGVSPPVSDFRTERAERELKEAEAALEAAQSAYRAIPVEAVKEAMIQAQLELGEARKAFQAGNEEEGAKRSEAAMEKARVARLKTMESPSVELRAIWVDYQSIQQAANRQGVASLMDKIAQAGFNAIYPEVFYQGGSIYPSQVAYQHEEYRSWTEDPMQVIVEEAHKRGLAVYPWVWAFCAGFGKPGPVLEKHPEWAE